MSIHDNTQTTPLTLSAVLGAAERWKEREEPAYNTSDFPIFVPHRLARRLEALDNYLTAVRHIQGRVPLKMRLRSWRSLERRFGGS